MSSVVAGTGTSDRASCVRCRRDDHHGEMKPGKSVGILTEEMRRVVEAELGFIATVCPDGTPNLSPKGTTAVWDDDHLVFADLRSPGTVENLRSNASIEINVVDQLIRKGYRFKGTGAVYTEGDIFESGVQFYEARGTVKARERIRGIVIVAVQRALPVISPAYDVGLTEDALRESNLRKLNARAAEPHVAQDG